MVALAGILSYGCPLPQNQEFKKNSAVGPPSLRQLLSQLQSLSLTFPQEPIKVAQELRADIFVQFHGPEFRAVVECERILAAF